MIAILSDIHGNFPALTAVLAEVDRLACTQIISLGDVTGYYAQPRECIQALRERQAIQLLGNHDKYLVEGTSCPRSKLVSSLIELQYRSVTKEQIQFLSTLSPTYQGADLSCVHGSWEDPLDQYMFHITYDRLIGTQTYYFSGHTHVQTLVSLKDKVYCNPGSVGQPRDGDWRAAFATINSTGDHRVRLHRVEYDVGKAAEAMKQAGFGEERLWKNLYQGTQIGGRIDKVTYE